MRNENIIQTETSGGLISQQNPDREPAHNPIPKPEVEPDNLPEEEPGQSEPERKKEDDDDDDYVPYEEPEIGDDPDEIKKGTIIM